MTISPTAPPGVAPVGVPAAAGSAAPAGDFLALIQAAMAEAAPAQAVEDLAAAAQGLADTAEHLPGALAAGTAADDADGADSADGAVEDRGTSGPKAGETDPGSTGVLVSPALAALVASPVAPTTPVPPAASVDAVPGSAEAADAAAGTAAVDAAVPQGPVTSDGPVDAAPAPQTGPSTAPADPAATTGVPGATPTTATTATTSPAAIASETAQPAAPLDRVSAQVFGEVTSLAGRGNGAHRITMTLNPESLGEVKVVMTVRDGAVHVRLAAGHEASASLLEGAPELARLLEHAGAGEARVVVRELPAAAVSATPGPASTTDSSGPSFQAGPGSEQSSDQHARTRADHPATDGPDTSTPRPTRAPAQPVIGTRAAGVDLTM